jgi:hypothetical protein
VSGGTPRYTPIWKLEAALKCRSCKKGRYAPPVHMIKLTETREITPYKNGFIPMRSGRVGGLSLRLSLSVALIDRANYPGEADVSIFSEGAR